MNTIENINKIKENATYKQILADSFGGVMYNVANANKYDDGKAELLALYETIKDSGAVDGIMQGAMNFLQGDNH
jgi:hypothetical protein